MCKHAGIRNQPENEEAIDRAYVDHVENNCSQNNGNFPSGNYYLY